MKKVSLFLISVALFWWMTRLLQKAKDNHQDFTQREQEILNQLAVGYKDNEIAGLLHMSEKSIQKYESNILRKTNQPDISSAIQYALERGLLRITYA
jgi:DNA-binding NarL/FixJ family response regulator